MPTKFYVYQLRAESENCPFYIGKGQGNRKYQHYQKARRGEKSLKDSKIRKYERQSIKVLSEVVFESCDEDECFALEIELIRFYGRRDKGLGCLANQTDGGEGRSGSTMSLEQRQKLSKALSGRVRSDSHCKNLSKAKIGKAVSSETKKKISASLSGRKLSAEHVEKVRQSRIGVALSPETKTKISKAHKGKTISENQKIKISKSLKNRKRSESSVNKGSKYSRQQAAQHVKNQKVSGLSQKQYCSMHSISQQTFCGWKRSPYVSKIIEG